MGLSIETETKTAINAYRLRILRWFVTDPRGVIVFFPYGDPRQGYVVSSDREKEKIISLILDDMHKRMLRFLIAASPLLCIGSAKWIGPTLMIGLILALVAALSLYDRLQKQKTIAAWVQGLKPSPFHPPAALLRYGLDLRLADYGQALPRSRIYIFILGGAILAGFGVLMALQPMTRGMGAFFIGLGGLLFLLNAKILFLIGSQTNKAKAAPLPEKKGMSKPPLSPFDPKAAKAAYDPQNDPFT